MRRSNVHHFHKVTVDVRLIPPCVDDNRSKVRNCSHKCLIVNYFAPGSIDKYGALAHLFKEGLVGHVIRSLV